MDGAGFTGVILAGGASRRMGTDKALLRVDGQPLLDLMRQKLLDAGADKIIVLGRSGLKDAVPDPVPDKGPVFAAMHYLSGQAVGSKHLFVPLDMPALPPSLLRTLSQQTYWAHFVDYNLPFLGVADGSVLPPPRRLYDLLLIKVARRLHVQGEYKDSFLNLNNPVEFAAYTNRDLLSLTNGISKHV